MTSRSGSCQAAHRELELSPEESASASLLGELRRQWANHRQFVPSSLRRLHYQHNPKHKNSYRNDSRRKPGEQKSDPRENWKKQEQKLGAQANNCGRQRKEQRLPGVEAHKPAPLSCW